MVTESVDGDGIPLWCRNPMLLPILSASGGDCCDGDQLQLSLSREGESLV